VVAVSADSRVAPRLGALKVLLYPLNATDERAAARIQILPAARWPLSFGIQHDRAEQFLLVIRGCADPAQCDDVLIEQKLVVRFRSHRTAQVSVLLTHDCLGSTLRCTGLQQTCSAQSSEAASAGSCVGVQVADSLIITPGDEMFVWLPSAPEPEVPKADAGFDAGFDAEPDAQLGDRCPADNSCEQEFYPCQGDDAQGYVCRGQQADWPIPDGSRDGGIPQSYDTSVDGVARDLVTGLSWERNTPPSYAGCTGRVAAAGDRCDWKEARAYCENLDLAGLRWRLPTKIELESLTEYRATFATLDPQLFFLTVADVAYWTASPAPPAQSDSTAYSVDFLYNMTMLKAKSSTLAVRCVHSSEQPVQRSAQRYVPRPAQGLVGDARTGLTWYAQILCDDQLSYEEAARFCAGLPQVTRVPSAKELLTLIDPTRTNPAMDPVVFGDTPPDAVLWSSSRAKSGWYTRWLLRSNLGGSLYEELVPALPASNITPDGKRPYCVRCVQ
jgi:hypothetical protein